MLLRSARSLVFPTQKVMNSNSFSLGRIFGIAAAMVCAVTAPLRSAPAGAGTPAVSLEQGNGIAATVNGQVITRSEVFEAARYQFFMLSQDLADTRSLEAKRDDAKARALQDLIDRELVISEFQRIGARMKPQYVDEEIGRLIREKFSGKRESLLMELKKQGISWPKFREQEEKKLIVMAMRSQAVQNLPIPTEEQKKEYFRKHESDFREEGAVHMRTIAVPKFSGEPGATPEKQRKLAEEIRRRVSDGADFASEARTYSQDSKAADGGDWGLQPVGALARPLAEMAMQTPVRSLSPVFEFRNFYYIVYVAGKQPGKLKPEAEITETVEKMVMAEAKKKAAEEWIKKLRAKAVIRTDY